jgi:hypothetical protein
MYIGDKYNSSLIFDCEKIISFKTFNKMIRFQLFVIAVLFSSSSFAMIRIENVLLNGVDVSPSSLCRVSLFNDGEMTEASLCIQIRDHSGNRLMEFYTLPFYMPQGYHSFRELKIIPLNPVYENAESARFLMTHQLLPEGNYQYCCRVIQKISSEWNDEYCEDFSSQMDSYLNLVSPVDSDTIPEQRPGFIWSHSGDFEINADAGFYRLLCVELKEDQNPSEALGNNLPVFVKDHLKTHFLNFPMELSALEKGKTYVWEVQKLSENNIVSRSGIWKFTIENDKPPEAEKYVSMSQKLNAAFYTARGNRIYFRFDERYSQGKIVCNIYNERRELLNLPPENEDKKRSIDKQLKASGYNLYELDLNPLHPQSGYYILEVNNEKNEIYKLKFYVP